MNILAEYFAGLLASIVFTMQFALLIRSVVQGDSLRDFILLTLGSGVFLWAALSLSERI